MNDETTIARFLQAYAAGDANTLDALLADGFVYEDATATTALNKGAFVEWAQALHAAFPDLTIVEASIDDAGAPVASEAGADPVAIQVSGQQAAPLDLSVFGVSTLPDAGVRLSLAPQLVQVHIVDGLIAGCTAASGDGVGIGAIIEYVNVAQAIA